MGTPSSALGPLPVETILVNALPIAAALVLLTFKDFAKELKMVIDTRRFTTLRLGEGVFLTIKRVLLVNERAPGEMGVR